MSAAAVLAAIRILAASAGVPVTWPNEQFVPPPAGAWIYAETTGLGADIKGVGAHPVTAQHGFLRMHVMVPANVGMDQVYSIIDTIAGLFAAALPIAGLQFEAATMPEIGAASKDGAYFGASVSIPFTYWTGA